MGQGKFAAASGAGAMLVMAIMASALGLYQSYPSKLLVVALLLVTVLIAVLSFKAFRHDLAYLRVISWMVGITSSFMAMALIFLL